MNMPSRMNWFGLAGAVATLVVIAISMFVSWWQLSAGDSLISANVSPLYTSFSVMGNSFTLPIVFAVNLSCVLLSLIGGVLMLVYSVRPTKSYAKTLLTFSFLTPLFFVVIFLVGLFALASIVPAMFQLSFPLLGSASIQLPSSIANGVNVSVQVTASFLWPFYLAVASAVLCIGARFYHKRTLPATAPANVAPPVAPAAPATPTA